MSYILIRHQSQARHIIDLELGVQLTIRSVDLCTDLLRCNLRTLLPTLCLGFDGTREYLYFPYPYRCHSILFGQCSLMWRQGTSLGLRSSCPRVSIWTKGATVGYSICHNDNISVSYGAFFNIGIGSQSSSCSIGVVTFVVAPLTLDKIDFLDSDNGVSIHYHSIINYPATPPALSSESAEKPEHQSDIYPSVAPLAHSPIEPSWQAGSVFFQQRIWSYLVRTSVGWPPCCAWNISPLWELMNNSVHTLVQVDS